MSPWSGEDWRVGSVEWAYNVARCTRWQVSNTGRAVFLMHCVDMILSAAARLQGYNVVLQSRMLCAFCFLHFCCLGTKPYLPPHPILSLLLFPTLSSALLKVLCSRTHTWTDSLTQYFIVSQGGVGELGSVYIRSVFFVEKLRGAFFLVLLS